MNFSRQATYYVQSRIAWQQQYSYLLLYTTSENDSVNSKSLCARDIDSKARRTTQIKQVTI